MHSEVLVQAGGRLLSLARPKRNLGPAQCQMDWAEPYELCVARPGRRFDGTLRLAVLKVGASGGLDDLFRCSHLSSPRHSNSCQCVPFAEEHLWPSQFQLPLPGSGRLGLWQSPMLWFILGVDGGGRPYPLASRRLKDLRCRSTCPQWRSPAQVTSSRPVVWMRVQGLKS